YLLEQRRRRAIARAFALERLQPSVAPVRPRWRRHVPVLALALALAILVGAAARPQRTVAVPIENAAIMLATDVSGSMTATDVARTAGNAKVPVYTVALGTAEGTITVPGRGGNGTTTVRVPPDPSALARIAAASNGKTFTAQTASGLSAVYERLGSQLGHKREKREITQTFAGGGLLLMMLGGV